MNNLYYLAVKQIDKITKDYNKLLHELEHRNDSDSKYVFTPRKYRERTSTSTPTPTPTGIRKRYTTADWRTTGRPDTPQLPSNRVYKSRRTAQELRSTLFDESKPETLTPYNKEMKAVTPPHKTKTTRGAGKKKRTIRKR